MKICALGCTHKLSRFRQRASASMDKTTQNYVKICGFGELPHKHSLKSVPVERVSSFKYLGVNISEDLTWTTHIQTQVKKARQRLYHLRQLRKFRVSPTILKAFYSGTIESVLTRCISVWYGNSSSQDCKALQRVVRLAERISGSALPSLQDIYLKRCRSRAVKIIKDSNHPGNCCCELFPRRSRDQETLGYLSSRSYSLLRTRCASLQSSKSKFCSAQQSLYLSRGRDT